jgi:hypothetical protein
MAFNSLEYARLFLKEHKHVPLYLFIAEYGGKYIDSTDMCKRLAVDTSNLTITHRIFNKNIPTSPADMMQAPWGTVMVEKLKLIKQLPSNC